MNGAGPYKYGSAATTLYRGVGRRVQYEFGR
jgi:hypothetical protein